ncbi:hypothetical protein P8452_50083 [Trifolium repens]|nr:hypothetical protein P8452_50083 [Trifolium repens]
MSQTIKMFLSYSILHSLTATIIFTSFYSLLGKYPFESFSPFMFFHILISVTLSFISSPSSHSIFEPSHTFLFFVVELVYAAAFSGSSFAKSLYGLKDFRRIRFRGGLVGLVFGFHYIFKHRWVLEFPIIQRSCFFKFNKGIPLAA